MTRGRLVPVSGRALLLLEGPRESRPWLLVADTHLGLSAPPRLGEGPPEASAYGMAKEIVRAAEETNATGVVHLGDVKEPIFGTPPPLRDPVFRFFATLLAHGLRAEVVLGNHDVGLVRHLPREVKVHPSHGIVRHGVGLFHGHRWPDAPVLRAARLVAGHLHPGVRLAPSPSGEAAKQRCWIRVRFPPRTRAPPSRRKFAAREMVILPPLNPLAGTEALNQERPARGRAFLYREFLAAGEARAYLLDGTDLGGIVRIPPHRRAEGGRAPSPGR